MILVYKTPMHLESQLNSALCGAKEDPMTMHTWLIDTLRKLDKYSTTTIPPLGFNEDTEMEAATYDYNKNTTSKGATPDQHQQSQHSDKGTQS
jgi:hypothetical protein